MHAQIEFMPLPPKGIVNEQMHVKMRYFQRVFLGPLMFVIARGNLPHHLAHLNAYLELCDLGVCCLLCVLPVFVAPLPRCQHSSLETSLEEKRRVQEHSSHNANTDTRRHAQTPENKGAHRQRSSKGRKHAQANQHQ